jgi:uncharacterized delta-60 repeat protein
VQFRFKASVFLLLICPFFASILGAPGDIDASFTPQLDRSVSSVAVQADGKLLIKGLFSTVDGRTQLRLARLTPEGRLDPIFHPDIHLLGTASVPALYDNLILGADGKIIVTGFFDTVDGQQRFGIARLNSDGTLDDGFNTGWIGNLEPSMFPPMPPGTPTFSVRVLGALASGQLIVSTQQIFNENGSSLPRYVRLNMDGAVDAAFHLGIDYVTDVLESRDGKLLVRYTDENRNNFLVRCDANGAIDPSFTKTVVRGFISTIAEQSDGIILAGSSVSQTRSGSLIRLMPDGSVDWTFNAGIDGDLSVGGVQSDGKLIVGGNFSFSGKTNTYSMARVFSDGRWDRTFRPSSSGAVPMGIDLEGRILAAGGKQRMQRVLADDAASSGVFVIERDSYQAQEGQDVLKVKVLRASGQTGETSVDVLTRAGSADAGTDFKGLSQRLIFVQGEKEKELQIGILNDNEIEPMEEFSISLENPGEGSSLGWQREATIQILDEDGPAALIAAFQMHPKGHPSLGKFAQQEDGKIMVGGSLEEIDGQPRVGIARLNADGSLDSSFNPGSGLRISATESSGALDIALQKDGKILAAGPFFVANGVKRQGLVRFLPTGDVDLTFDPGERSSRGYAPRLLLRPNGKILLIGDLSLADPSDGAFIRSLNEDGTLDSSFHAPPIFFVTGALMPSGQLVVAGGDVMRLQENGDPDPSFIPLKSPNLYARNIVIAPDGKILLAGSFPSLPHQCVLRLLPDGRIDEGFAPDLTMFGSELLGGAVAVQEDGKILGTVQTFTDPTIFLVRFNADGTIDKRFEPVRFDTGFPAQGAITSMQLTPAGNILAGGYFQAVNDVPYTTLVMLKGGEEDAHRVLKMQSLHLDNSREPEVTLSVPAFKKFKIQASEDLRSWIPISTNFSVTGKLEISDTLKNPSAKRFYSAVQVE